ncbi:MAG: proline--tRNA ligase [Anaerolineae bacterium]|nr:proline--tRNA ligase [Anaerolineae bacterium]
MSQLFGQTLREPSADAQAASYRLLVQAGFIRPLGAGIFSYLHLARRSMTKIEAILREEIERIGGQEITMPVVRRAERWTESGRRYQTDNETGRSSGREDREPGLAMSHDEMVAALVRTEIRSYKQLPRLIYHLHTRWQDDPRPRAGLIRAREFIAKDSYSLDGDWEGLDRQYRAHYQAYYNIFHRCSLPVVAVRSDASTVDEQIAHEFIYLTPIGEDTLLVCDACGYMANRQVARFRKPQPEEELPQPIEKVATPGTATIADLANFLGIPTSRTAKAIFRMATFATREVERLVFAVVRGDMDLNEAKLASVLKACSLRPAQEEEIRRAGAVPGYASPIGVRDALVVVDDLIPSSPNLVAGANEEGYHLINVNYGRDYRADIVADIAMAEEGCACSECGAPMRTARGIAVGSMIKQGTRYAETLGCTFLDRDGQRKPVVMGSYAIGVSRLLACIAEEHHDELGLSWPISVAPYQVHLVALPGGEEEAGRFYAGLRDAGVEVLYDDRDESAGVKFNDADLIGIPIRLTVSKRSLAAGGAELKLRRSADKSILPGEEVIPRVVALIEELQKEIAGRVRTVPFR